MYLGQWTPPFTFPAPSSDPLSDLTGAAADWIRCETGGRCGSGGGDPTSRPSIRVGTVAPAPRTLPTVTRAGAGVLGLLAAGGLAFALTRGR